MSSIFPRFLPDARVFVSAAIACASALGCSSGSEHGTLPLGELVGHSSAADTTTHPFTLFFAGYLNSGNPQDAVGLRVSFVVDNAGNVQFADNAGHLRTKVDLFFCGGKNTVQDHTMWFDGDNTVRYLGVAQDGSYRFHLDASQLSPAPATGVAPITNQVFFHLVPATATAPAGGYAGGHGTNRGDGAPIAWRVPAISIGTSDGYSGLYKTKFLPSDAGDGAPPAGTAGLILWNNNANCTAHDGWSSRMGCFQGAFIGGASSTIGVGTGTTDGGDGSTVGVGTGTGTTTILGTGTTTIIDPVPGDSALQTPLSSVPVIIPDHSTLTTGIKVVLPAVID